MNDELCPYCHGTGMQGTPFGGLEKILVDIQLVSGRKMRGYFNIRKGEQVKDQLNRSEEFVAIEIKGKYKTINIQQVEWMEIAK